MSSDTRLALLAEAIDKVPPVPRQHRHTSARFTAGATVVSTAPEPEPDCLCNLQVQHVKSDVVTALCRCPDLPQQGPAAADEALECFEVRDACCPLF
jgi:hypothetical protein